MIICDYLTVSTPKENGPILMAACSDVCLSLAGSQTDPVGVRYDKHGLLRYSERNQVGIISVSGYMLAALRSRSMLFDYLSAIASNGPYKVTHADVARDEQCDAPERLALLYSRLRVAGAMLTRKRTPPSEITTMFSRGQDGRDTGSIMIGDRRSQETTVIVYDRQADARRKGKADPGPLLRTEVRTGIEGLSLKDAACPEPLFWHIASPTFGERPADVPEWQPWGEGFVLPVSQVDLMASLRRLVDGSRDLERMMALADKLPGNGLQQLEVLLAQRLQLHRQTVQFTAGTAQPVGDSGGLRGKLNG